MADQTKRRRRSRPDEGAADVFATVATRALELEDIAVALASSEEIGPMGQAFLPIVATAVGAGEACLFLAPGGSSLEAVAHYGYAEDQVEAVEESLVEQAAGSVAEASEEPVTRGAILEDESYRVWCSEQGLQGQAARPRFELYAPLRVQDSLVAVLAVGRRSDGADFTEEDTLFIQHVASSASLAVRRCALARENAEQLHVLRELARFSREITATLDLNQVLQTVANTTEAVIERDRACVALLDAGRLRILAVSEKLKVELNEDEILGLNEILPVLLRHGRELRAAADDLEEAEGIPDKDVFARHFEAGEMQSLLVLPLRDEEGLLGFLILESRNPAGFSDRADKEFLDILSGAVTVAIRNADLYRRVPMVGFLGRVATTRRQWGAMSPRRRWTLGAIATAAVVLFGLIPWPRFVAGSATVRPSEVSSITLSSPGVIRQVFVRGGESVAAGEPVAVVRNRIADARLAAAEADYEMAQRRATEAASRRDAAETRRWSLQARNLAAWMNYSRSSERDLRLTSRVHGVVLTPRVEERVGEHLEQGDTFCEVARLDTVHVEVRLFEADLAHIAMGNRARLKVLAFPDRQFIGRVVGIAPQGSPEGGKSAVFVVRLECANPELLLLSGMSGRAKIDAGRGPVLAGLLDGLTRTLRLNFWI